MRPAVGASWTTADRHRHATHWGPTLGRRRRHLPAHRNVRGFTIIELLVTVVILGILAALALNMTDAKESAYLAVMRSDIRTLIMAQESYFADNLEYAKMSQLPFSASPDVQVVNVAGNKGGWSAKLQHKKRTDFTCAVFIGNPPAKFNPAVEESVIACEPKGGGGGGGKGK